MAHISFEKEIPEGYEARIEGNKVIFEPKESEDERIRNLIYCLIRDRSDNRKLLEHNGVSVDDALAYLERQKEQKSVTIIRIPKFRVGDIIQRVSLEKWDSTKKITSIDEHGYNFNLSHLGDTVSGGAIGFAFEDEYELVEQQPAEWSEEDEKNYEYLHQVICNYINNPQIEYKEREKASKELIPFWERLKSLCPQPH